LALAAEVAKADFTLGTPTNLGPTVNSPSSDVTPSILDDGLELYFASDRPGGYGGSDIWVTTRATTDDDWGEPVNLGPIVNSSTAESGPSISHDGLTLYFSDYDDPRPGGFGGVDLWVTTRPTKDDEWGEPVNLGATVNTSDYDIDASISSDGLELYFMSNCTGGYGSFDLLVTTRATTEDDWGTPVNLGPTVNSADVEHCPTISADGLTLFFDCSPGDLIVTRRATPDDEWGEPVNLGHSASDHFSASISADGSTLFFGSDRPDGSDLDIWQVPIIPVVDFNGDGKVDNADISIMAGYWNTDEPACDIGPTPLGDGIVDVQDLLVLTEYLAIEADIAAIKEVYNQATLACGTGDAELYLSIFTEDAVVMAPGGPAVNGKAELRPIIEGLFGVFDLELPYTVDEVGVPGDWAFARSRFLYSMTPKEGGETTISPGEQLDILKRQADGSWKIHNQSWNFDVPPPASELAGISWEPGIPKPDQDVDAEAMYREMCDLYTLAAETGDIDLYVANYTADGVQMPPEEPARNGSEQIRAVMEPALTLFDAVCPIYPQEAEITGDWAFGRADWSLSLTPKEGGATTTFGGKGLDVLKRQADGSWKYYISCWSYNGPPIVE
jgi:uncharacterized protein (TIGR02246 family)